MPLPVFQPAVRCSNWLLRQGKPVTQGLELLQRHPNWVLGGLLALLALMCGVIVTR